MVPLTVLPLAGAVSETVGGVVSAATPDWETVTIWPATVKVPARAEELFAATLYLTVPFPEPLAPEVMVIHDALLEAVQEHLRAVVTVSEPVPAVEAKVGDRGETV